MPAKKGRALVTFDDPAFNDDLQRLSPTGRKVALSTRRSYETDGVPLNQLRRCDTDGHDGTSLPGCLKVYLPPPDGRFGMVLHLTVGASGPGLRCLAIGIRHHPGGSHAPTVYQVAHERLHA